MKISSLLILIGVFSGMAMALFGCIGAGKNSDVMVDGTSRGFFPEVVGIDLTGKERRVPQDMPGSIRLVIAAYQRQQQADVDSWIKHMAEIRARFPEVTFIELPVIPKGSAMFRFYVNNGMRRGVTDPERRTEVITVYTDVPRFLHAVGRTDTHSITPILIDGSGKILASAEGPFSETQLDKLLNTIPGESPRMK